jgi:CBS domain-containing protein
MREAPHHKGFLSGLAQLGFRVRPPLSFWGRLEGPLDIKKSGLVPVQNLARYYSFARGITAQTTLERLVAVDEDRGSEAKKNEQTLREAFISMSHLQLRHHANRLRNKRPLDNVIDPDTLRPLTRVGLQEALRLVAAEQRRFPRILPHL